MPIVPILRSLVARHKTASALIIVEIALTFAIVSNAVFLINERLQRIHGESGVAEDELLRVQLTGVGQGVDPLAQTQLDLEALRELPGVSSASMTNQIPYGVSSWNSSLYLDPDQPEPTAQAAIYMADEHFLDTLGLRLAAGRAFSSDEYLDYDPERGSQQLLEVSSVIITRALAERLYSEGHGVGEIFYFTEGRPIRVVGIVDTLVRPSGDTAHPSGGYSVILPVRFSSILGGSYVLRTDAGERARVLSAAVEALAATGPDRIVLNEQTFEEVRQEFFQADRAMAWLLVTVSVLLLVVTALGIVGLASFWVQQRTRAIGVRRALGATRGQVLRDIQLENFLLTTLGIALGVVLAYAMSAYLMQRYELPRLPVSIVPLGALTLWALGQLAVLGPALRAAAVPPAVATRSL